MTTLSIFDQRQREQAHTVTENPERIRELLARPGVRYD